METPRKPRAYEGEPPELTKLKQLPTELQDAVLTMLQGDHMADPIVKPLSLSEVRANLLLPPFEIELSADSQLSRWRSWYLRKLSLEAGNDRSEQIAEWFAKNAVDADPEQIRTAQLAMLSIQAEQSGDKKFQLAVLKEVRWGEQLKVQQRKIAIEETKAQAVAAVTETGKKLEVTPDVLAQIVSAVDARLTAL